MLDLHEENATAKYSLSKLFRFDVRTFSLTLTLLKCKERWILQIKTSYNYSTKANKASLDMNIYLDSIISFPIVT